MGREYLSIMQQSQDKILFFQFQQLHHLLTVFLLSAFRIHPWLFELFSFYKSNPFCSGEIHENTIPRLSHSSVVRRMYTSEEPLVHENVCSSPFYIIWKVDNSFLEVLRRACLQHKNKGELKYVTLLITVVEVVLIFGMTCVILLLL